MFLLRAVLNILVRNASPRGPMCFRCLIFNLSGPCELLFLLYFIVSWTREVVSVMLYSCMLCVAAMGARFTSQHLPLEEPRTPSYRTPHSTLQ